jgi:ParB-like chromosome segregation protein Spo0J
MTDRKAAKKKAKRKTKVRKKPAPDLSHISKDLRPLARPIGELSADPKNARLHPDRNRDALAASLKRFGQRKPAVVRKDGMLVEAGNCLLDVAAELGWTHVAVVVEDDDASTAAAYALADNRSGELAEWDISVLADVAHDLQDDGMDLAELGFEQWETESLFEHALGKAESPAPPGAPPEYTEKIAGEVEMGLCPHCEREFLLASAKRAKAEADRAAAKQRGDA